MSHTLDTVLEFDTDAGPLITYQCECGRLFDAPRFAAHTGAAA